MAQTSISSIIKQFPFLNGAYENNTEDYPQELMSKILNSQLAVLNIPTEFGGGLKNQNIPTSLVLTILKLVGARDLSAGRVYEGHLNALLLIDTYGSSRQKEIYFSEAKQGVLFGIWNAELPNQPLELNFNDQRYQLNGGKIFCSGANFVKRPIVPANFNGKKQMVVLKMEQYNLEEDYEYWQPLGMKGSVSCGFDFSGGAIRFAAVQLGGAKAMIDETMKHLIQLNRTETSNQIERMAEVALLNKSSELWLQEAGKAFDRREENPEECLQIANMFRTIVRDNCEEIMMLCEKSVGLQGLLKPHPMERIHRDLSVYLKQPNPDGTFKAIGQHFIRSYEKQENYKG